jgi:hypothetical protein
MICSENRKTPEVCPKINWFTLARICPINQVMNNQGQKCQEALGGKVKKDFNND